MCIYIYSIYIYIDMCVCFMVCFYVGIISPLTCGLINPQHHSGSVDVGIYIILDIIIILIIVIVIIVTMTVIIIFIAILYTCIYIYMGKLQ